MLLDLLVVRFAMYFSLTSGLVILSVLWSLGWSMVVLGFLARLPMRVSAALSIAVIVLHNLTDGIRRQRSVVRPGFGLSSINLG